MPSYRPITRLSQKALKRKNLQVGESPVIFEELEPMPKVEPIIPQNKPPALQLLYQDTK